MTDFQAVLLAARGSDWDGSVIFQIIVVALFIGGPFLLKWLKSGQNNQSQPQQQPTSSAEDNERIRRIREEVARRAAQQRGGQPQRQAAPPPVPQPKPQGQRQAPPKISQPEPVQTTATAVEDVFGQAISNNGAMIAELETAKRSILEAQQKANALLQATADKSSASVLFQPQPSPFADALTARDLLQDKKTLRASIVAREILSPPLALRDGHNPLRRQ